jgi:hypothetical protein
MNKWISAIGPINTWPNKFQDGFDAVCLEEGNGNMQGAVDAFLRGVEEHIEVGREILKELWASPVMCPLPYEVGWADYLGAGDILESGGESGIRKWTGLLNHF